MEVKYKECLIDITELLKLAKNGDDFAKEMIIKKYYGLVIFQAKGIYLTGYTFEDLIQTGIQSILKAIDKFDIEKEIGIFNSYVFWSIKNNFNYLCRREIKYNQVYSLNTIFQDGMESIDFIPSKYTLEEVILQTVTSQELLSALKLLDKEELELINFLYLSNDKKGNRNHLSDYARLKDKSYYYCTSLKKRALRKLKCSSSLNE